MSLLLDSHVALWWLGLAVVHGSPAFDGLDHLQQAGVRVPDDVGVMGYDGLDHATRHPPYLTTVRIPWRRMIETALEELARHKGGASPVKHVSILGDVVAGKTVRQAPEGRP